MAAHGIHMALPEPVVCSALTCALRLADRIQTVWCYEQLLPAVHSAPSVLYACNILLETYIFKTDTGSTLGAHDASVQTLVAVN